MENEATAPTLTLRDMFAIRAMQAIIHEYGPHGREGELGEECYRLADIMLEARDRNRSRSIDMEKLAPPASRSEDLPAAPPQPSLDIDAQVARLVAQMKFLQLSVSQTGPDAKGVYPTMRLLCAREFGGCGKIVPPEVSVIPEGKCPQCGLKNTVFYVYPEST